MSRVLRQGSSRLGLLVVALLALLPGSASAVSSQPAAPVVTHGVVVGDVTPRSAVLWARADRAATMNVVLSGGGHGPIGRVAVTGADDFTGTVPLAGLHAATSYDYRVWFSVGAPGNARGPVVRGSFRTPPAADEPAAVKLAFGGDVAGQNVCRDVEEGLPIMDTIRNRQPDVFVGLGDMIYADNACEATGRYGNAQVGGLGIAVDLPGFWAHWRYNRADGASQRLLRATSYVGVWDDHEVVNDFGPLTDAPTMPPYSGIHLLPTGLQAFIDYTPIATPPDAPQRLYRSLRWGMHLELFVLDTRQYRDANFATDSVSQPKTMLGREQLTWLKERLASSDATWKVLVSSVPMSIPTGFPPTNGRDGWANFDQATGFEQELLDILRFMEAHDIDNPVWITTDVHFAEVFRYRPFADNPSFTVHELATGPLNAGIFPNRDFDATLSPERLFFHGPATADAVTSWTEAKRWFNFGTLEVDEDGALTAGIVDTAGQPVFSLELAP
jgi:alkaline phosphatase D